MIASGASLGGGGNELRLSGQQYEGGAWQVTDFEPAVSIRLEFFECGQSVEDLARRADTTLPQFQSLFCKLLPQPLAHQRTSRYAKPRRKMRLMFRSWNRQDDIQPQAQSPARCGSHQRRFALQPRNQSKGVAMTVELPLFPRFLCKRRHPPDPGSRDRLRTEILKRRNGESFQHQHNRTREQRRATGSTIAARFPKSSSSQTICPPPDVAS